MNQGRDPEDGVRPEPPDEAPPADGPPRVRAEDEGEPAADEARPSPTPDAANRPSRMAGVELADGKVAEFDLGDLGLAVGDLVVVDNERDLNLGRVVFIADNKDDKTLHRVIRRVGPEDLLLVRRNKKREEEAFEFCQKRIAERRLPMKLIRVAYLHGGNKAIFFFSADGRVDFRALVRDLAQQLHVRIEMRQIGVRDESKMLGGIGICGQQLCCTRFLRKFVPVSIKMAKNQNLALNPQKLSGLCGRLMCCLVYEDKIYRDLRKLLPKMGSTVETPEGEGRVVEHDILGGKTTIQLDNRRTVLLTDEARRRQHDRERAAMEQTGEGAYPGEEPGPVGAFQPADGGSASGREGRQNRSHPRGKADPGKGKGHEGRRRRRKKTSRDRGGPGQKPAKDATDRKAPERKAPATPADKAGDGTKAKKRRKRRSKRRARRRKSKDDGKPGGKDSDGSA